MKKNIIFNKYYRHLRKNVFADVEMPEFLQIFNKFLRLSRQYRLLQFAEFLEKIHIPKSEIPFIRFIFMFLDFLRWKIYDLCLTIINGKIFKPYRLDRILWSSRWGKNYIYG